MDGRELCVKSVFHFKKSGYFSMLEQFRKYMQKKIRIFYRRKKHSKKYIGKVLNIFYIEIKIVLENAIDDYWDLGYSKWNAPSFH